MKTASITIRGPAEWAGRVDSDRVRGWLVAFLRNPWPLPPDPGAGGHRFTVWLPRGAVKKIAARLGMEPSEFVRRLIAARLPVRSPVFAGWPAPVPSRPVAKPIAIPRVLEAEVLEASPVRLISAWDGRPAPHGFAWRDAVTVVPAEQLALERRMREHCRLEQQAEELARTLPVGAVYLRSNMERPSLPAIGKPIDWPRLAFWLLVLTGGGWLLWEFFFRGVLASSSSPASVGTLPSFKAWFPLGE